MSVKRRRPARNDSTAISFAAFSTAGRPPPASSARYARRRPGNVSWSGRRKSRRPQRARSSRGRADDQRSGYEKAYWIGRRMSVTPNCARIEPSTISTIECTTDCGCTTTSMRSAGIPKSQRASMTSSPLFISVAESIVILRPIRQVGCLRASSGPTAVSSFGEWPRNGPPEAVRIRRPTSCGGRSRRHWWMALCSLSTGRIDTPRRRAASVISAPAITSTSLLARAIVFPASIAASTASSAAVPDEAHSTMSTSGCVARAISPSVPHPAMVASARPPA